MNIFYKLVSFVHEVVTGVKPPSKFVTSMVTLIVILTVGTTFYSLVENWSFVDSLYFSVATIATVGYGDLHPTSDYSKVFTIIYIFIGAGFGLYVLTLFSKSLIAGREKRIGRVGKIVRKLSE